MKVKCIRASQSDNKLVVGQVYEVETEVTLDYFLVGMPCGWLKDRFEIVEESAAPTSIHTTKKYAGNKECPCGMPSDQCDYHRGM